MATINYDFYDNKDIYDDGKIEKELLDYYKNKKEIDFSRDDIFYLTTPIRENIISWYPFEKNSKILEVGAGLGTITGYLCEIAQKVTAVEGSKKRSNVILERHKNRDNLDIIVGNLNKINFKEKYDYIIMIGVFEYSKLFFESDTPFDDFLTKLKSLLTPKGKIIFAIENRYGIKYWAGNKEDHLGESYIGFKGYEDKKVQTFGKIELENIIKRVGFKKYKFYYPFPDYKMPQVIYTDDRLPNEYDIYNLPIYNFSYEDYYFNPKDVLKGLINNNQFGFFSNSFIVELSDDSISNISYAKYQSTRNVEYSTITIQIEDNLIYKKPIYSQSIKHLDNMVEIQNKLRKIDGNIPNIIKKDDVYYIDYIKGESLETLIINDITKIEKYLDSFIKYLDKFCIKLESAKLGNEDLKKIYKDEMVEVLKYNLLDFNLGNVMVNEGKMVLFDQEWEGDKIIPKEYIIYFSIKLFFEKINRKDSLENKLYKKYNISNTKRKVFDSISNSFFMDSNKVFNKNTLIKLISHSSINIKEKEKNLANDLDFYKDLLEKTKSGYEEEIARLNKIIINLEEEKKNYNIDQKQTIINFIRKIRKKCKRK